MHYSCSQTKEQTGVLRAGALHMVHCCPLIACHTARLRGFWHQVIFFFLQEEIEQVILNWEQSQFGFVKGIRDTQTNKIKRTFPPNWTKAGSLSNLHMFNLLTEVHLSISGVCKKAQDSPRGPLRKGCVIKIICSPFYFLFDWQKLSCLWYIKLF